MRWFWGFLLLLIGFILLGNNVELWQINLTALRVYWPLLLIILGVSILVRHLRFGYLIMILTILASLGFIYLTGVVGQKELTTNTSSEIVKTEIERAIPEGVKKAKIVVDSGAVKINITGSTEKLISGTYESNQSKATTTESISGDTILYTIKTDRSFDSWNYGDVVNTLNLKLANTIPIELEIDAKASSLDLDLKEQKITSISINSAASVLNLTLGNNIENGSGVSIQSGASKLNIKVPKDLGVNLKVKAPLTSGNLANLKQLDKGSYATENFADAVKKINFNINAAASSIEFGTY